MEKIKKKLTRLSLATLLLIALSVASIPNSKTNKIKDNEIIEFYSLNHRSNQFVFSYTAIQFAQNFNDYTYDDCKNPNQDNSEKLSVTWPNIKQYFWNYTSTEGQSYLKTAKAMDSNQHIASFCSRYDHIISRYGFENFVGRNIANQTTSSKSIVNKGDNAYPSLTLILTFIFMVTLIGSYSIYKNKKSNR